MLFRDENGKPACVKDECAHRACPLSLGKVVEGKVECAYHGWQFQADGACTKMPSTTHCPNVAVSALPCVEKDGFVWVWPGEGEPPQVGFRVQLLGGSASLPFPEQEQQHSRTGVWSVKNGQASITKVPAF